MFHKFVLYGKLLCEPSRTDRHTLKSIDITWGTAKDIVEDRLKVQDMVYSQNIWV